MLHIVVESTLAILPVFIALFWLRRWVQRLIDTAYNE
jgi:hypothetical protein